MKSSGSGDTDTQIVDLDEDETLPSSHQSGASLGQGSSGSSNQSQSIWSLLDKADEAVADNKFEKADEAEADNLEDFLTQVRANEDFPMSAVLLDSARASGEAAPHL